MVGAMRAQHSKMRISAAIVAASIVLFAAGAAAAQTLLRVGKAQATQSLLTAAFLPK